MLFRSCVGSDRNSIRRTRSFTERWFGLNLDFSLCKKKWPNIQSYSASYWVDTCYDKEKEYSETCASYYKANHHHFKPKPIVFFENVIEAINATGLPLLRMQTALLRSLTNIIPVNCNNILCGQGADAVFGLSYQMEFLSGIRDRKSVV